MKRTTSVRWHTYEREGAGLIRHVLVKKKEER
jgi:hypothetical protein